MKSLTCSYSARAGAAAGLDAGRREGLAVRVEAVRVMVR
jgi:hypothetical protein